MGLLKALLSSGGRKKKKDGKKAKNPAPKPRQGKAQGGQRERSSSIRPWTVPPARVVDLPAQEEREGFLFIYDGTPFKGMRAGATFPLDVYRGDAEMRSIYTGTEWSSRDSSDSCVLYGGKPVGFCRIPGDVVEDLAKSRIQLRMTAVYRGTLRGYNGCPDVRAIVMEDMSRSELLGIAERVGHGIPLDAYSVRYRDYDPESFAAIAVFDDYSSDNVELRMLPVPKGSQAKPHIGVYAPDGKKVSELGARNEAYRAILEAVGAYGRIFLSAERCSSRSGKAGYEITIYCWD